MLSSTCIELGDQHNKSAMLCINGPSKILWHLNNYSSPTYSKCRFIEVDKQFNSTFPPTSCLALVIQACLIPNSLQLNTSKALYQIVYNTSKDFPALHWSIGLSKDETTKSAIPIRGRCHWAVRLWLPRLALVCTLAHWFNGKQRHAATWRILRSVSLLRLQIHTFYGNGGILGLCVLHKYVQ
jgi:hypothetical protein